MTMSTYKRASSDSSWGSGVDSRWKRHKGGNTVESDDQIVDYDDDDSAPSWSNFDKIIDGTAHELRLWVKFEKEKSFQKGRESGREVRHISELDLLGLSMQTPS
jgi:hypothetical protein